MKKLSGVILTHDNIRTIDRAVSSLVGLVDELIIIDDYSSDATLSLIKKVYPQARIYTRKLDRFDVQRNFGIERAEGEWIVMIDSDEEVSPRLGEEIKKALRYPDCDAYQCYLENETFNAHVVLKLERFLLFKSSFRFKGALHEKIHPERVGFLPGKLLHHSWIDVEDWVNDINQYSGYQAKKWLLQNRNYSKPQLLGIALVMPVYQFVKMAFFQKRILKGVFQGVVYPLAASAEWIFSVMKYYELKYIKKESPADIK
jgi:glycosyltransferase involved in cell wall biosynthesis